MTNLKVYEKGIGAPLKTLRTTLLGETYIIPYDNIEKVYTNFTLPYIAIKLKNKKRPLIILKRNIPDRKPFWNIIKGKISIEERKKLLPSGREKVT